MAPDMNHWGEAPLTAIDLHIYPAASGRFTLWEDDGETMAYRQGEAAATEISFTATQDALDIQIGERVGQYEGMPNERSYRAIVHAAEKPNRLSVNGAEAEWSWEAGGFSLDGGG